MEKYFKLLTHCKGFHPDSSEKENDMEFKKHKIIDILLQTFQFSLKVRIFYFA